MTSSVEPPPELAGPLCAFAPVNGSGLTTGQITDGLEYIAMSPLPEYGGFHPNTVRLALGALEEITRLRSQLADLYEGRSCVLPKTTKHAHEIILVAEACLKGLSHPNVEISRRAGTEKNT